MIQPKHLLNKNIFVLGLGKAGISTIKALKRSGAYIYAWDDQIEKKDLQITDINFIKPQEVPWSDISLMVMSPGIPFSHPKIHPAVSLAKKANCKIICDIEILYQTKPNCQFIGITGTNGKSTTTSLIGHILKHENKPHQIGGNIGIPALDLEELKDNETYVIEMSSYQLDLIDKMHFNISVFLNITPDHLSRHGGVDGYIKAKKHIYDQQNQNDSAIIGIDDEYTYDIYQALIKEQKIGKIIPISIKKILDNGITIKDNILYDNTDIKPQKFNLPNWKYLPGKHNLQNIAASYAATKLTGLMPQNIISAISAFSGLKHRLQLVKQENNIKFINDSKATNAQATACALDACDDIYWILGGQKKEGGIDSLHSFFPKIHHVFLIGASQDEFALNIKDKVPYTKCNDLENAFGLAVQMAESNNSATILLSPACASWDQWTSFEARGEAFCNMVYNYKATTTPN